MGMTKERLKEIESMVANEIVPLTEMADLVFELLPEVRASWAREKWLAHNAAIMGRDDNHSSYMVPVNGGESFTFVETEEEAQDAWLKASREATEERNDNTK